jgi:hypothetical protein
MIKKKAIISQKKHEPAVGIGDTESVPPERCWKGKEKGFGFNYMIKVQKLSPSIMVTRKPIVCESAGKELVVQGEDASPPVYPT